LVLVVVGAITSGFERKALVTGFPASLGKLKRDEYREFTFSVQNLTPLTLRVVSRPCGCSDTTKIEAIAPYGRLTKTGAVEAETYLPGKHRLTFDTVGYCGDSPFLIENSVAFEVAP